MDGLAARESIYVDFSFCKVIDYIALSVRHTVTFQITAIERPLHASIVVKKAPKQKHGGKWKISMGLKRKLASKSLLIKQKTHKHP